MKTGRNFEVTVKPSIVVYAGSWTGGEYTVTMYANSAAEAVSMARRERRENEGSEAVPATFRAKLAK